jgi:ribosome-associated translation inhibitor RaiA
MSKSDNIKDLIEKEVEALQKILSPYSHCKVVIDETKQRHSINVYEVKVYLTVPSDRIYIANCREEGSSHKVVFSAVRDAFDNIRRQLLKTREKITHNHKLSYAA